MESQERLQVDCSAGPGETTASVGIKVGKVVHDDVDCLDFGNIRLPGKGEHLLDVQL